ncbi:polysaccharide deacetylase family protein [candidate division WWE3 bacterium]|uniref:Polysaccharide deacetylase family protein n=1 Tax=candidate division WWE3 bacterium TaxID=2053526 RepID=A0A955LVX2_UNCKA|nr:polysaccharide deacetylase family protein [candidate division WWE3 bacterium]
MKPYSIITTSWDDGHIFDIQLAELLKKYQIPATFYISPRNQEWSKNKLLTEAQVFELAKEFEIGAHTMTHPELTKVPLEEAKKEIEESKTFLETILGKEVPMFCYPRGLFNNSIKNLTKDAGFKGARTTQAFRTSWPEDLFEIGTTHHTINRSFLKNVSYSMINRGTFLSIASINDWLNFGKGSIDIIEKHGGIWHLWGHSWQIEENGLWDKLEELFQHIASKSSFTKLTNGEIVAGYMVEETLN